MIIFKELYIYNLKNIIGLLVVFFSSVNILVSQDYQQRQDQWVNSVLSGMTLDQKIGQLFMVRGYSKGDVAEEKTMKLLIRTYHIGGICFFQGDPITQASLTNAYQSVSRLPLLIGMDAEWGLGMRFTNDGFSFPRQLVMGASTDDDVVYDIGKEIGRECKRIGIHLNFAPVVDVNNNPRNPVIFDRSFGESPEAVTRKARQFVRGLESEGVMGCLKHFPGHGDTDTDSHHALPYLYHELDRLDSIELVPFRNLLTTDASAVMIGHLHVPSIDARKDRPTSLSANAVRIIREDIGFDGLIFTDAMDMKAITQKFKGGSAEVEAVLAGNDIILLPDDIKIAFQALKNAVASGKISEKRIDESVVRILKAKFRLGLITTPDINLEGITLDLHHPLAKALSEKVTESALTLLKDEKQFIPFAQLENKNYAVLGINASMKSSFQNRIDSYTEAKDYQLLYNQGTNEYNQLLTTLSQFHHVIVGVHTSGKLYEFKRDVPDAMIDFLKKLQEKVNTTIVVFGSPYIAAKFSFAESLLLCYDNEEASQDIAAQCLFGATDISGHLPVSVNEEWVQGYGIFRHGIGRLGYATPERVGLSTASLSKIDSVMADMIAIKAAPGGQVLVAKDRKIVFDKNYGTLKPGGSLVTSKTIYDVASLTKVLSTTLATMKLNEEGKIDIHQPLKNYISNIDTTNKADLIIEDLMAHHARLMPWIAFYENTIDPKLQYGFNPIYYSGVLQNQYIVPVAEGMFLRADYRDTMWQQILESPLRTSDSYRYSDLGFYLMQKVVENQCKQKLNQYSNAMIYKPLHLQRTSFKPLELFSKQQIAPSTVDDYWRHQVIQGYVHDMGSAMLGGVGGHAGLFSTAEDVAIIMQMLLNKGEYGGMRIFKPETIDLFTHRHPRSTRRGIGFDMKELDTGKTMNMSEKAPASTFGHTGFTGTAAFADPENNIIFVFMSNRTYPNDGNNLLNKKDIRKNIHTIIYDALVK